MSYRKTSYRQIGSSLNNSEFELQDQQLIELIKKKNEILAELHHLDHKFKQYQAKEKSHRALMELQFGYKSTRKDAFYGYLGTLLLLSSVLLFIRCGFIAAPGGLLIISLVLIFSAVYKPSHSAINTVAYAEQELILNQYVNETQNLQRMVSQLLHQLSNVLENISSYSNDEDAGEQLNIKSKVVVSILPANGFISGMSYTHFWPNAPSPLPAIASSNVDGYDYFTNKGYSFNLFIPGNN